MKCCFREALGRLSVQRLISCAQADLCYLHMTPLVQPPPVLPKRGLGKASPGRERGQVSPLAANCSCAARAGELRAGTAS